MVDCFVIYFRIVGLARLLDVEIVGSMQQLYAGVNAQSPSQHNSFHSSVYGGFLLVPLDGDPLLLAASVRKYCIDQGVELAIGISHGPITQFEDLHGQNFVGTTINRAARLAFLDACDGRISVSESTSEQLRGDTHNPRVFDPADSPLEGLVKKTNLQYRWYSPDDGRELRRHWRTPSPSATTFKRGEVHVLLYDIAGYSDLDDKGQLDAVLELGKKIVKALRDVRTSKSDLIEVNGRTWYSPGGDGGVVVFDANSAGALLIVAEKLAREAAGSKILLRVALHSGPVAFVNGPGESNLPVGATVLATDLLSGEPDNGGMCVSFPFWSALSFQHIEQLETTGWKSNGRVRIHGSHAAFLLRCSDDGQALASISTQVSPKPSNDEHVVLQALPDCVVVQSSADIKLFQDKQVHSLRHAMSITAEDLDHAESSFAHNLSFEPPYFVEATDLVESRAAFRQAITLMCRAPVVVFDVTNFEPAVMLLIGIRAAVRRSVTVLSAGGEYVLGGELDVPFNIKEANLVAHSENQYFDPSSEAPQYLLTARIQRAFEAAGDPGYADLPVYHRVRNLEESERRIVPAARGVVVLCPFLDVYAKKHWGQWLRKGLASQLKKHKGNRHLKEHELLSRIRRSYELQSAKLVSTAIYGALHSHTTCVADWTWLVPNIFFELGVRLAVAPPARRTRTINLIERDFLRAMESEKPPTSKGFALGLCAFASNSDPGLTRLLELRRQFRALMRLFCVIEYSAEPQDNPEADFEGTAGPESPRRDNKGGIFPDDTAVHDWIVSELDVTCEPESLPLDAELISAARKRFWSSSDETNSSLFDRADLLDLRLESAFDGHMAMWLLARWKYGIRKMRNDGTIRRRIKDAAERMKADKKRWNRLTATLQGEINDFVRKASDLEFDED